jgi:glucose-1-phosphate thymidylyltransferase
VKGIILAGGRGTRLYPITQAISKQLIPVYDKPLIYYPLSVLLLAGIHEILIISTPEDTPQYMRLLSDGSRLGVDIEYMIQDSPRGLADAFILGGDFIGNDSVCLVLGDNVFYGQYFSGFLDKAISKVESDGGGEIFGYPVANPTEFGVVEFSRDGKVISIEEKPSLPKSKFAVPGLYFYDNKVVEIAKSIKPSARGEIEITAINNYYLEKGQLNVILLGRGMAWLDTGSPNGMLKAAEFVRTVQDMQGFYIACIEELAWRKGFINTERLWQLGVKLKQTEYGQYIISLAESEKKL